MSEKEFKLKCFLCSTEFQYGNHIYGGQYIRDYDITVCNSCYSNNRDGWVEADTKKIIEHLDSRKLPVPKLNDKGWLPRGQ